MGGLGIPRFRDQAHALKQQSIRKLFAEYDLDWVFLAKGITQHGIKKGHWVGK